jgi:hypothetical protein
MPLKFIIPFVFIILISGCDTLNHYYKIYLGSETASRYESGDIYDNSTEWRPNVEFLNYHSSGYYLIKGTSDEDIKRAGIILHARSVETYNTEQTIVFGNNTDSCHLHYTITTESIREGRSAERSVSNLATAVKGNPASSQHKPFIYPNEETATGTISIADRPVAFYFDHAYSKKPTYDGWLILNGDTLKVRQVNKLIDENAMVRNAKKKYAGGFELVKGEQTYAAFDWNNERRKVFILKQLSNAEKNIIAGFLFIATCCH